MSRGQGYLAKGHFPEVEEGYDYRVAVALSFTRAITSDKGKR